MSNIIMVSDIVEANGKTCKENNLEKRHEIAIGTLVEIIYKSDYEDEEESKYGLRLFVVNHSRDCDGTPLYDMSFNKAAYKEYKESEDVIKKGIFENKMDEAITRMINYRANGAIMRHYDRESLKVVTPGQ